MKKYGTFSEEIVGIIIRETLCGLGYLHSLGKIHRDIKAANLLLTDSGNVKLADFGVSGQITATISKKNTFVGTPYWMAPEVILRSAYNTKADIWSLGITCWELLHGLPPNAHIHPMKVLFKIPKEAPPSLPNTYSEEFQDFFAKCLEKKQSQRPSVAELLKHSFITHSKPLEVLRRELHQSHERVQEVKVSAPTLKKYSSLIRSQTPMDAPNWDFSTEELETDPRAARKYNDTLRIGKSVAFEDEFDLSLPEQQYQEMTPFGYDLLKTIVIPAFAKQRGNCNEANQIIMDQLIDRMGQLAVKEPVAAEQACRKMLEDLFSSSRQSLKEFLATISKKQDEEDFELDDQDAQKLSFHSTSSSKSVKLLHYRSKVAECLLQRWLKK
jgi:serine/threonine protein kinase